ncbi:MAG TPA: hypothetical protein VHL57_03455, partial [Flavobacteriales bacterium]|nr:hypothetical protein [Flavobacteriales bacterium]
GFPINLPFATALTVRCDHNIQVLSLKKGDFTHPLVSYNYDTGEVIDHQEIGCAELAYPEAGISPKMECGDPGFAYAVNAMPNYAFMVTSDDGDPHYEQTRVLPTLDMTIVRER